jgi:hypothetical protein
MAAAAPVPASASHETQPPATPTAATKKQNKQQLKKQQQQQQQAQQQQLLQQQMPASGSSIGTEDMEVLQVHPTTACHAQDMSVLHVPKMPPLCICGVTNRCQFATSIFRPRPSMSIHNACCQTTPHTAPGSQHQATCDNDQTMHASNVSAEST